MPYILAFEDDYQKQTLAQRTMTLGVYSFWSWSDSDSALHLQNDAYRTS